MTAQETPRSKLKEICTQCGKSYPEGTGLCPSDGAELMTTMLDPMIGVVLPRRYRIIDLLGRGSMSVVYKGTYEPLDQLVAVKILKSHLVSDPHQIKRFQQEIKTAGSLSHPNIIGILDFGVTDQGVPYLIMEYLAGKSIAELLDEQERLSVNRVIKIFSQAAEGLSYAHREGVVHRDIKPSNMLVVDTEDENDVVKIVDFGIAKIQSAMGKDGGQDLTSTGEVLGTPLYMSPEQAQGRDLDGRSDIYSLGCVMYHALTGRPPFVGDTALDTMRLQISAVATPIEIVRPDLYFPERLQQILTKALAKDPRMRYQRMEHFKADLESCTRKDSSSTRVPMHSQSAQPLLAVPEKKASGSGISLTLPTICVIVGLTIGIGTAFWAITTDVGKKDPKIRMPLPVGSQAASTQDDLTAGETALNEGRYEDAEKLLIDAKAETSKAPPPNENYARTMIALAQLYYQEDKLTESEKACREALKTARALSLNSPLVADVLTNLSRIQCANGKYKEAEMSANEALGMLQKQSPDNPEIAPALQALAEIQCKRGNIDKGADLLQRADQIAEKAHGEDDLDVAAILNDLGMVRERQKSYAAAGTLFARALGIRQKLLGTEHPLVSDTQCAMGTLNFNMRKYDSAEAMFNNALDIRLKAFGEKSSKTAEIYSCLAILFDTQRKYPQAEECYRKAVEIRQAVWGPESPRLARSLEHLARFLREHGQANGAEVYEAQLKRIQQKGSK